ncbi:hypothetical protein BLX90_23610 (plasmid) [Rhizobium sp. Y9]|jgi:hypothetical protein|nr:hypothetical protein BLX90_23610 [Rhizobium sp. Y9]
MFLEIWKASRWDKNRLSDEALKQRSDGEVAAAEEGLRVRVETRNVAKSFHHLLRRNSRDDVDRQAARTFDFVILDWVSGQSTII